MMTEDDEIKDRGNFIKKSLGINVGEFRKLLDCNGIWHLALTSTMFGVRDGLVLEGFRKEICHDFETIVELFNRRQRSDSRGGLST